MRKTLFLLLAVVATTLTVNGQTLKKQNELLKDSIVRINNELILGKQYLDAAAKDNDVLRQQNGQLAEQRDSLYQLTQKQSKQCKHLEEKCDSLGRIVTNYQQQNQELLTQLDFVKQEMETKLELKKKQENIWARRKYFNIGYANQQLEPKDHETGKLSSDFAVSLTTGRTYYLHKKPILNMIRFGIDWSYLDFSFAKYSQEIFDISTDKYNYDNNNDYYPEYEESETADLYKMELGMQVGPSITINPVDYLKVSAYFRYAPCFSILLDRYEGDFYNSYGSFFVAGAAVSYKVISLGVEKHWGTSSFDTGYDYDRDDSKNIDWKSSGPRFYISFRF